MKPTLGLYCRFPSGDVRKVAYIEAAPYACVEISWYERNYPGDGNTLTIAIVPARWIVNYT